MGGAPKSTNSAPKRGVAERTFMALVGLAILFIYTVAALGGLVLLRWLFANPPELFPMVVAFAFGVVVAAYVGYRLGTVRLVASLRANELPRERAPELYRRLDRLSTEMRLARPAILVANLGAANALSVGGPRKGIVVVDQSLLRLLTVDEFEAILAHELAHMESYDTFVNTLVLTTARTLVGFVFVLLLPFVLLLSGIERSAAWFVGRPERRPGLTTWFRRAVTVALGVVMGVFTLLFLAYSRRQEYAADRRAADVTGKPAALARALSKIHRANDPRPGLLSLLYVHHDRTEEEHPLLSTHPPLEERIQRLLDRVDHSVRTHHVSRLRP